MGICNTKNAACVLDTMSADIFRELGLQSEEIQQLYKVFNEIDITGSGSVPLQDMCSFCDIPESSLITAIFKMGDTEGVESLNFCRFVCSIWCFLTLETTRLGSYSFVLYDVLQTEKLTKNTARLMLRDIHGSDYHKNVALKAVTQLLLYNSDGIPLNVYSEWCDGHPSLYAPILTLQATLRQRIFGEYFWEILTNRRSSTDDQVEAVYMWKINSMYAEATFKQQLACRLEEINKELSSNRSITHDSRGLMGSISSSISGMVGRIPSISLKNAHVPSPRHEENILADAVDDRPQYNVKRKPMSKQISLSKQSSVAPADLIVSQVATPSSCREYGTPVSYVKSATSSRNNSHTKYVENEEAAECSTRSCIVSIPGSSVYEE